jgi:protein DJ-1
MSKSALVVIADGTEEMEATITIDVLRRAEIEVTVAGLGGPDLVTCSRGVVLRPDAALAEVSRTFDALVLPGGRGGAEAFAESAVVGELLRRYEAEERLVATICAAAIALARHGVFGGKRMTAHPTVHDIVTPHGELVHARVVEDGQLVTSQGPGTAFDFALALVARLLGPEKAAEVRAPMRLDA